MFEGLASAAQIIGSGIQAYQNYKYAMQANKAQEKLLQLQNEYNSAEAEKQRAWEAEMSNTAYQRARKDMEAAGINPILLGGSADAASTPQGYAANSAASHSQHVPQTINIIGAGINSGLQAYNAETNRMNTVIQALGKAFG